jgi:hypothetical protein
VHGAATVMAGCRFANNRANATVGRFAQMVRYFCGRGGGSLESHGTMGHPGRLGFCVAEHPDTVLAPFHTQFGLPAAVPVVVTGHDVGHIGPADIIVGFERLCRAGQVDGPVAVASSTPYSFGFGLITPPDGRVNAASRKETPSP